MEIPFAEPFPCGGGGQTALLTARCTVEITGAVEVRDVIFGGWPLSVLMDVESARQIIAYIESEIRRRLVGQPLALA